MKTPYIAFPIVPGAMEECDKAFLYALYNYVKENGNDPGLGVQQLAESAAISRAQLNRKLSELLGCSANSLIMGYRFFVAKQLLCESDLSVKEIAAECGFRRHSAFCRSFTAEYKCSPTHYRKTYQTDYNAKPLNWKIPLHEDDIVLLEKLASEKSWLFDLLKIILSEIDDNRLTLDYVSVETGITISTLNRKVKELFKVTPKRFIRDVRIQYACELLSSEGSTVSYVAYQAGFFDPAHFCRSFKATLGYCPSDYRSFASVGSIKKLRKTIMIQNGK